LKKPKRLNQYTKEGFARRTSRLIEAKEEALRHADRLHVKLQRGNTKTGNECWTVSLLPIIDCVNSPCKMECYDLWHCCVMKSVVLDRARNSAIHEADIKRFWNEVDQQVKANYIRALRINVGGDLKYDDFKYVDSLATNNPNVEILFFTKNYAGINEYLEQHRFPQNLHAIMSAWKDFAMDNPHNLPVAHVLYADGSTTAPEYGAVYCNGNCTACLFDENEQGCWELSNGDNVIFPAH